jgi:hypothetical protein
VSRTSRLLNCTAGEPAASSGPTTPHVVSGDPRTSDALGSVPAGLAGTRTACSRNLQPAKAPGLSLGGVSSSGRTCRPESSCEFSDRSRRQLAARISRNTKAYMSFALGRVPGPNTTGPSAS